MKKRRSNDPFDMDFEFEEKETNSICPACKTNSGVSIRTRNKRTIVRRAMAESKLGEILPVMFKPGDVYHCISGGDIDALSFLKHIVKMQDLNYCFFSTWCMATDDIEQFRIWLNSKKIVWLDAYVGEIFTGSYSDEFEILKSVISKCPGRVAVFRNHSKIIAGKGKLFSFVIESSANINTNPRTEQTVISVNSKLYAFYKKYFDGIKSFNREFDKWKPYK